MNKTDIIRVDKFLKTTEAKNGQQIKFLEMKEVELKSNKLEMTLNNLQINMQKTLSKYDYDDVVNLVIDIFDGLMFNKKREINFSVNISDLSNIETVRKLTTTVLLAGNNIAVNGRIGLANVIFTNSKISEILKEKILNTEFIIVESLKDRVYLYRRNNTTDITNLLFCYDESSNFCDFIKVGDISTQLEVVYLTDNTK